MNITKINEKLYFIAMVMSGLMMLCGALMFFAGLLFYWNYLPLAITMMISGIVMFILGDVFVRILVDMEREIL